MKDSLQFLMIMGLLGYILFLQQCNPSSKPPTVLMNDTIIQVDTILPAPVIVRMTSAPVPPPTIIYIDSTKKYTTPTIVQRDEKGATPIHQYKDSLSDENLTIYYDALVQGELLQNQLDYQLKIPKQITKTVTIKQPIPVPSNTFLLTGGVGLSPTGLSSVLVGMQFISKKGFAVGYDYDILQNSHQVKLGVQLFKPQIKPQ